MHTISFEITHSLGSQEAQKRVQGLVDSLKTKFSGQFTDPKEFWDGNKGAFEAKMMGMDASGNIVVHDDKVEITMNLPAQVSILAGFIKNMVVAEVNDILK